MDHEIILKLCRGQFHNPENREFKQRKRHPRFTYCQLGGNYYDRAIGQFGTNGNAYLKTSSSTKKKRFRQWSSFQYIFKLRTTKAKAEFASLILGIL